MFIVPVYVMWDAQVTVGSCRKGQHREWAVRHPRACYQPTQAGSFRRSITAASTPLKQREGVVLARHCRFAVSAPLASRDMHGIISDDVAGPTSPTRTPDLRPELHEAQ